MDKLLMAIIFSGFGIFLMYTGIDTAIKDSNLNNYGETVEIKPFSTYSELDYKKFGITLANTKTANINFITKKGEYISIKDQSLDNSTIQKLENNEPVYIIYLPDNPQIAKMKTADKTSVILVLTIFGFISFILGSFILIVFIKEKVGKKVN